MTLTEAQAQERIERIARQVMADVPMDWDWTLLQIEWLKLHTGQATGTVVAASLPRSIILLQWHYNSLWTATALTATGFADLAAAMAEDAADDG